MQIMRPIQVTDAVLGSSSVNENEYPVFVSSGTVYTIGDTVQVVSTNVHKVYKCLTGTKGACTSNAASPSTFTWTGHGRAVGDVIKFDTSATVYYIVSVPTVNTLQVSTTPGGAAVQVVTVTLASSTVASAYGVQPAVSPAVWLDSGSTNKWKMFDQAVNSQTTSPSPLTVQLFLGTYVDTIAFLNVAAQSIRVQVVDSTTSATVYDVTQDMSDTTAVVDWATYFYTPITKSTDTLFTGLPYYSSTRITVTLTDPNASVACGAMLLGTAIDISATGGGVEQGAKLSIQDYSLKTADDFGNYTIVERAFSKQADFTVYINNSSIDRVYNMFAQNRAKPTLYIGNTNSNYRSTIVYGFYKDFAIEISYPTLSVCTVTLEGLT